MDDETRQAEETGSPQISGGVGPAQQNLLVSTDWLAEHLHDPLVRVVDCRYNFNPGPTGREMYQQGHIPGAIYLDLRVINEREPGDPPDAPWLVAGPRRFAEAMSAHGIGDDTLVVAYDDEGDHYAARLWWALALYGHDRCRLLAGGLTSWTAEGRRLDTGETAAVPARFSPRQPRPGLRATADDVRDALHNPAVALLDVRRPTEYSGEEVRAARGGHIPGAIPLFWRDNLNWEGDAGGPASGTGAGRTWRPMEEVRARHHAAGVTPDRRVITYCQLGVRAAHAAFTLRLLGYPDVAVYDGSWQEWAGDPARPVAP